MGCVSGKPDINDQHSNIFEVANVNEQGELISHGHLQVAETELVLYQRGKQPTVWPLRSLRKYGFDSEIFSFECGRRCPTGQGIYAFRCRRAEQLFNIVQQFMTVVSPTNSDFPIPPVSTGPPVQRRPLSQSDSSTNIAPISSVRPHPTLSRPGSVTSNGPVSPPITTPSPIINDIPLALEHNNNHRSTAISENPCAPQNLLVNPDVALPNYANIGIGASAVSKVSPENYVNMAETACHLYMNVDTTKDFSNHVNTKELTDIPENLVIAEFEDTKHCYANIDTRDLEHLRPMLQSSIDMTHSSVPPTPTSLYLTVQEVNYAELDLDPGKSDAPPVSLTTPDSPTKAKKSYATIDFNKTNALSQSTNPRMDIEEGSRKTRHNSTISDVTARNSNSLSD